MIEFELPPADVSEGPSLTEELTKVFKDLEKAGICKIERIQHPKYDSLKNEDGYLDFKNFDMIDSWSKWKVTKL